MTKFKTQLKQKMTKKSFWLALIPAVILVVQVVASWFGYNVAADAIGAEAATFVNAVFAALVIIGAKVSADKTEDVTKSKSKGDR